MVCNTSFTAHVFLFFFLPRILKHTNFRQIHDRFKSENVAIFSDKTKDVNVHMSQIRIQNRCVTFEKVAQIITYAYNCTYM